MKNRDEELGRRESNRQGWRTSEMYLEVSKTEEGTLYIQPRSLE